MLLNIAFRLLLTNAKSNNYKKVNLYMIFLFLMIENTVLKAFYLVKNE